MKNFEAIKAKLGQFITKYYINELIKGLILFFSIGVLYFLITLLIEYFLWLGKTGRTILFWTFILVEFGLFFRFLLVPLAKLFKISKGIDYEAASRIIGRHFPEVSDKLINVLQLGESSESSELLLASIDQKSAHLQPVPFKLAINFKKNIKYLKYAIIPIALFLLISVFNKNWFSDSYDRVVHFQTAYEPPAPFQFYVINDQLKALENTDYVLQVKVTGDVIPENATIHYNDETYFLKQTGAGAFEYKFNKPKENVEFVLQSNEVISNEYVLDVVAVPALLDFKMVMNYPRHTGKKDETIKGTGNAVIPEGTKIIWKASTRNTEKVSFLTKDTMLNFSKSENVFELEKSLYSNVDYELSTSNKNVKEHDNIAFSINVVKDRYPEINLQSKKDSLDNQTMYFLGQVSDDYGLSKLRIVYYKGSNSKDRQSRDLQVKSSTFDEFVYTFPDNLNLEEGVNYEFYFEVFDNDAIHRFKSSKSEVFNYRKLTKEEEESGQLKQQNETISQLDESLDKMKEREQELKELSRLQKEKKELNFNDKKKLENFIERQKQQEKMMKNFTKNLKENLDEFKKEDKKEDPFKDALKERLERNEERLKKNEELLEELKKISEKIKKEELTEKLEELAKQNQNSKKNLEQLVELSKRYYVIKKHERLAEELNDLAKRQKEQSEKKEENNNKEDQDKLNEEFEKFQEEMENLRKSNEDLKKPMNLDQEKEEEESIKKDQEKASEGLEKNEKQEAGKKQESAAKKMKEMSDGMQMQMQGASAESQQEDAEMLRQILDNLVAFSLEQEALMKAFKKIETNNPSYVSKLKRQSVLRENFIHIDDSLYALALRTPKITENVTEKLTDIEFNIEKSLSRLAENQMSQGTASQQYTVTGANDLAYLLSEALDNMNQSMSMGSGKGKSGDSKGFQLPDIIKKQGELSDEMKKGSEKGKKGKGEKEGEKGEEGQGSQGGEKGKGKDGKSGKSGEKGSEGEGENGEGNGKDGKSGKNGKNGKSGKDKEGNGEGEGEGEYGEENEQQQGRLYEIFKQQQQLRQALEDRLAKEGLTNEGSAVLKKMKQVEQELLIKGFDDNVLSKMIDLKHELLKLKDATFQQGKEDRRESKTNKKSYSNTSNSSLNQAKQYFNTTEILNRQVLPLRQNHKRKVQEYFKKDND